MSYCDKGGMNSFFNRRREKNESVVMLSTGEAKKKRDNSAFGDSALASQHRNN